MPEDVLVGYGRCTHIIRDTRRSAKIFVLRTLARMKKSLITDIMSKTSAPAAYGINGIVLSSAGFLLSCTLQWR